MPLEQEARLHRYKTQAAVAFARANKLDRIVIDSPQPRFGIVTIGKSYLDVRQALDDLGIGDEEAARIGLRIYKVAMSWPLEPEGARHFAEGLSEILVVEEKHAFIESQMKESMYNWTGERPSVVGKYDEAGEWILPSTGELTPARIARVLARRIQKFHDSAVAAVAPGSPISGSAPSGRSAREIDAILRIAATPFITASSGMRTSTPPVPRISPPPLPTAVVPSGATYSLRLNVV